MYLGIRGDFKPDEVAKYISLKPWESKERGERCKERDLPRCSILDYGLVEVTVDMPDLYDMSEELIDMLEPHKSEFIEVSRKFDVGLCWTTCLWMMTDQSVSTPPIGFSSRVCKFIGDLGASIDIDLYRDDGSDEID